MTRQHYWDPPAEGPVRDFVGYGNNPPHIEWPNGATLAVSLCLNVEEGSERSHAFGDGRNEPNPIYRKEFPANVRDLATESIFEYGSRIGVHRVLDIFDDLDVHVTAFACAVALAVNPPVARRIVDAGHEICSHGLRWTELWTLTRDEERQHIRDAVAVFEEVAGVRPVGWYSRYGPSVNTRELLVEEGFLYDSDAYNDDFPYYVQVGETRHLVLPYSLMYNDGRFDGPEEWLSHLKRGFDYLLRESERTPKMMSIGLHPRWVGQPSGASVLREFLEHALSHDTIWFARRDEIARVFRSQYPPEAL